MQFCAPAVLLGAGSGYGLCQLLRMRSSGSIISVAAAVHPTGGSAAPGGSGAASAPGGGLRAALARALRNPATARLLRPAVPLLVSGLAFAVAEAMGAEPLLACVAAGLVAANWR